MNTEDGLSFGPQMRRAGGGGRSGSDKVPGGPLAEAIIAELREAPQRPSELLPKVVAHIGGNNKTSQLAQKLRRLSDSGMAASINGVWTLTEKATAETESAAA